VSINFAIAHSMTMRLTVLQCGECEPLKAGIHGTALGLFALMGLYNGAAWLKRQQPHLAINAVVYTALTIWEQHHVAHHLATIRRCKAAATAAPVGPPADGPTELAA
jgi:hypothetical protein